MQDGIRGVGVVEQQHLLDGVFRLVTGLAKLLAFSDGDGDGEIRGLGFVFSACFIMLVYLSMPKGLQVCIVR